jgi:S-adenosylmethionine decarboxylase
MPNLSLHGFNNLTKSLSFSLYKLHYIDNNENLHDYNAYINNRFSADNLNILLSNICHDIGGNVLNVAKQNYAPQGASVTLMISEEATSESIVAHIDKSHLCIHTYPEESPQDNVAIFRADIELSTCGVISPLKVLNSILTEFDADVIDIDYRIRGMTRNRNGSKRYTDKPIESISEYLSYELHDKYSIKETNQKLQNLYHAKLSKKDVILSRSLFSKNNINLTDKSSEAIITKLKDEINQLTNNI